MCACEPGFVCSRCVGTPDDARYEELEPRDDDDRARPHEPESES